MAVSIKKGVAAGLEVALADLASAITNPITGTSSGKKVAGGTKTGTATPSISTGLTTVTSCVVSVRTGATDAASLSNCINCGVKSISGGTVTAFRRKATGEGTTTLIASTAAGTLDWVAYGT